MDPRQTPRNISLRGRVDEFFRRRAIDPATTVAVDLHNAAHALEDIPAEIRDEAEKVLQTPTGASFQRRVFDVLENAVVDAYGHLECVRVLRFLADYSVTDYTYALDGDVSRGSRPDTAKIKRLVAAGYGATINLCAETPQGDVPYITAAGVQMQAFHVPVIDGSTPSITQVVGVIDLVERLRVAGVKTFIHCEAGKARTGIMVACLRMATMGWSLDDAMHEARNFGLEIPAQVAFVENFARQLSEQYTARRQGLPAPHPDLGSWPSFALGSTHPTPQQLTATLQGAARSGRGGAGIS